jgi:DegV family protein with EDD domain
MPKVRIVSDSACDIPPELVAKLDIRVISAYVNVTPTQSLRDDGQQLDRAQYYQQLRTAKPFPTTSAPPPGEAEAIIRQALDGAEHVVAVHLSGNLSSIINSTRIAAQNIGADKVSVYDGGSLSMGTGWLAVLAAERAQAGDSPAQILEMLAQTQGRAYIWAVPDTLEYLRRSGRVSSLLAGLGDILQLKPILRMEKGEVLTETRVRTSKKIIPKLAELCQSHAPLERLAVLDIDNPQGGQELMAALADLAPTGQTYHVKVSPAVGTNFGPGGLGVAFIKKGQQKGA